MIVQALHRAFFCFSRVPFYRGLSFVPLLLQSWIVPLLRHFLAPYEVTVLLFEVLHGLPLLEDVVQVQFRLLVLMHDRLTVFILFELHQIIGYSEQRLLAHR